MDIPKATIRIIGTNHVAKQSAEEIERVFREFDPDIVAVELDRRRLQGLQEPKQKEGLPISMIKEIGVVGYAFLVIGRKLQQRMGSIVKVEPGIDMLTAVELAKSHHKQVSLVDQDILITMRRLSKQFSWKEKFRLVWDLLSSPFAKEKIHISLDKVPDKKVLDKIMKILKDRYPSIYTVLIIERNIAMVRNLDAVIRRNPGKKILLVIGAGHGEDLRDRLHLMKNIADIMS
jgi:pheromone shutdown-related protein TraB